MVPSAVWFSVSTPYFLKIVSYGIQERLAAVLLRNETAFRMGDSTVLLSAGMERRWGMSAAEKPTLKIVQRCSLATPALGRERLADQESEAIPGIQYNLDCIPKGEKEEEGEREDTNEWGGSGRS